MPRWKEQDLGVEYRGFVGSATDLRWFLDPVTKHRDCEDGLGAGPRGCESQLCHLRLDELASYLSFPSFHFAI